MRLKYILSILAVLFLLGACDDERYSPIDETTGFAELFASIGEAEEVQTRADETAYKTYSAFTSGDRIGLYATGALRKYVDATDKDKEVASLPRVTNLPFEMYEKSTNIKWGDPVTDKAILKWDTKINTDPEEGNPDGGKAADIYAYFPYQDNNGNCLIFDNYDKDNNEGQLTDILVAQRTTVENNNPAIFLTFKHRFALLHLSLGTGMAAVTQSDEIFAITSEGIDPNATIQMEDYVIRLNQGNIKNFKARKHNNEYYIILPAGKVEGGTNDSLQVKQIKIGNDAPSDLAVPIRMQPSTIYHMTMHKHEGSITFEENGIEIWGGNSDLGGIREEPGIYWASDMRNLILQYNNAKTFPPGKDNLSLQSYGTWDDQNNRWVFNLMRHIDMTDIDWDDQSFKSFYGIFNGNGYSITGFDITDGYGLFDEVVSGSAISDLTLTNISVDGKEGSAGALAGTVSGGVTIHNCHVTGNSVVHGGGSTGGLIGNSGATITRCSSSAEVNATGGGVGGLIGDCSGTLEDSYATGRVIATGSDVGGLVGSGNTIKNCYAAGSVTGEDNVGGLAGTAGDVDNCYAVGDINGKLNVGGLIGSSSGEVKGSSSGGTVTGESFVGGLIGNASGSIISSSSSASDVIAEGSNAGGLVGNLSSGSLNDSHATGDITAGGSMVGGLVGYTDSEIINSYAICNVTGANAVGGLVGQTIANVENCKADGDIKGGKNVGGLIGETTAHVENCKAQGNIIGDNNIGGLIGQTSGNVSHSSSVGTVTGEIIVGGLIGVITSYNEIHSEVSYSYSRAEVSSTSGAVGGLIGQAPAAVTKDPDPEDPESESGGEGEGEGSGNEGEGEGEGSGTEDPEPEEPIIIKEYVSGPKITYSYATNGLPLMGTGGWIEYSYDTGNAAVGPELGTYYYSIDLSALSEEKINTLIEGLNSNSGGATPAWEAGIVNIGGVEFSLPILTSNK